MIYPSDFKNYPKKDVCETKNSNKLTILSLNNDRIVTSTNEYPIKLNVKSLNIGRDFRDTNNMENCSKTHSEFMYESIWERYCNSSTVHGFKYISDTNLHWSERITWICLVSLAAIGILYVSFLLKQRFSSNRLATVVESTFFPIYEIPYPAVTICNYNRVNAKHIEKTMEFFLPNGTDESKNNLYTFLEGLNGFEFGSFEEFSVQNLTLTSLEHINITDLYRMVTHSCEDLFRDRCWWRNKYMPCCSIFVQQRSEYGICYTFNSVLNYAGKQKMLKEIYYPWRTSNYGDWSGLRTEIYVDETAKIPTEQSSGILVIVHHPYEWPNSAHFIPTGTITSIVIKPTYSYTTSNVKHLTPQDRDCIYPEDAANNIEYITLPGLPYLRSNCYSECRQRHMLSKCNCTLDFLYPVDHYHQCNISDIKCLFQYDSYFNYEKPPNNNNFFPNDEPGMVCHCLPQCEFIEYGVEVSTIQGAIDGMVTDTMKISLDIHFQQATMVKYRTSVVFDWMDLLVAFGGIAGLFLGCSLLSVAEIVFYFTIGLLMSVRNIRKMSASAAAVKGNVK